MTADPRISVVVLTHERPDELARMLRRLMALPEQPQVIVVDNASQPGSVELVLRDHPQVEAVRCEQNRGAAGRNAGVALVRTPYVAFCDDDTWWAPGALRRAADLLDAHHGVAALSARVLVGEAEREDPACDAMVHSPLDSSGLPGPALIGFMAGAVVMRTAAFHAVGGYEPRFFLGAEEWLMALHFPARGWHIVYAHDVVTHHHPSPTARDPTRRHIVASRNRLWIVWMRLPVAIAGRFSLRMFRDIARTGMLQPVLREALAGLPWVLRERVVVPPRVSAMVGRVLGMRTRARKHGHGNEPC